MANCNVGSLSKQFCALSSQLFLSALKLIHSKSNVFFDEHLHIICRGYKLPIRIFSQFCKVTVFALQRRFGKQVTSVEFSGVIEGLWRAAPQFVLLFCCHGSVWVVLLLCVFQVRVILSVFHREKRRNLVKGRKSRKGLPGMCLNSQSPWNSAALEMVVQEPRQRAGVSE